VGHFSAQCRTKAMSKNVPQRSDKQTRRVHVVDVDDESDEFAFMIGSADESSGTVDICVGGVPLRGLLIDSGATCNLIDRMTWEELKQKQIKCISERTTKKIYSYASQTALQTVGQFTTVVDIPVCQTTADFVVIEGRGQPILGKKTAMELGVLRIGLPDHTCNKVSDTVTEFISCHSQLFEGVGKLENYELQLHINPEVRPVAQNARRVPYGLRDKVANELQNLLKLGIIEPAEGPTPLVSPVVVVLKSNDAVRICVDMRQANNAILRERHPIPTVDEMLHELNQSTVFSKLDLRLGFHQLVLHKDSRAVTTFATHLGLFRYTRLFFGVNSAPEVYQHILKQVLSNCVGAANIADDIIVHGKTSEEHDRRLLKVLKTLLDAGLTLNREKCQFSMNQLEFMGHLISHRGIGPTKTRVEAIANAREPKSVTEVRSFLGLVNFCARFIPNFASVCEPLRRITRQSVEFEWKTEQQMAFQKLKQALCDAETLAFFDKDAETQVIADAGPVGLGAVLVQIQNGEHRVICYASRSLSDVERRYSQTEKEALALVWACERFHVYLLGVKFKLITDHKPLEVIYGPRSKPSARIERWLLHLQQFDYQVVYKPGNSNVADSLSRLLDSKSESQVKPNVAEEYVRFVALQSAPCAVSIQEMEKASKSDPLLCKIRQAIDTADWSSCDSVIRSLKDEMCKIGYLVLRGTRIIVPACLQQRLVHIAHEGHQGIVKTKARLRSKLWWPGMDKMVENTCKSCFECQLVSAPVPPEPMIRTPMPKEPWQHLAADLLGPLPDGYYVLVVIDYYSRYFEVRMTKSITSTKLIQCLSDIFATHGLPVSLKTDNAQCFVSKEFTQFLQSMDIRHTTSIPLWPQSNGEVERQNRTVLKFLKIVHSSGKDMMSELNNFLSAYRTTPHAVTGMCPSELLFRRKVRSKLPEVIDNLMPDEDEVRQRDSHRKSEGAHYVDRRRNAKISEVIVGDRVLLQQNRQHKLSTTYKPENYTVIAKTGCEVTIQSIDGVQYRRNVCHVKKFVPQSEEAQSSTELDEDTGVWDYVNPPGVKTDPPDVAGHSPTPPDVKTDPPDPAGQSSTPQSPIPPSDRQPATGKTRQSARIRHHPDYLQDYACDSVCEA